jgi:hypothetical protein
VATTAAVGENRRGAERRNMAVEGHEVTMVLANGVGVAIARVKLPVLMRVQIIEKCRGAEEEVFVCLGQTVTRKGFYESVKWSRVEVVGKVGV